MERTTYVYMLADWAALEDDVRTIASILPERAFVTREAAKDAAQVAMEKAMAEQDESAEILEFAEGELKWEKTAPFVDSATHEETGITAFVFRVSFED